MKIIYVPHPIVKVSKFEPQFLRLKSDFYELPKAETTILHAYPPAGHNLGIAVHDGTAYVYINPHGPLTDDDRRRLSAAQEQP